MFLDLAEASAILRLQPKTIYNKVSSKELPHYKKGRRLFFVRSELEDWIKTGKVESVKKEVANG